MARACRAVTAAMDAVAPQVVPGVTMDELREEVELQLRRAGSLTPSFPTHIFTGTYAGTEPGDLTSGSRTGDDPLRDGTTVLFDFGGVVDGYCSDFGRTIACGEPSAEVERAYEAMLAAQEAGRAAARPGTLAREVNAACRAPIEEAGLGEHFRHRMGHAIGLDVHERPFISPEDETPLEVGMTFTDEPSIIVPGAFGVRIEDIVVCEEGGGRYLVQRRSDRFLAGGGFSVNRERPVEGESTTNAELTVSLGYDRFAYDFPRVDVSVTAAAFLSLTQSGRERLEVQARLQRELAKDFYATLRGYESYDDEPATADAEKNDWGVTFALGWSF